MAKLLYIEASPRKNRSVSIEIAAAFRDAYLNAHPGDEIRSINLWNMQLPELTGELLNGVYAKLLDLKLTAKEAEAAQEIHRIVEQFMAADKYIFSLPMWNFSVPYKLKHYLDIIVQPGQTFSHTPGEGYRGLLCGKPATLIYARGGEYAQEGLATMDFQKSYMEHILRFIGIGDIHSVVIEPTLVSPPELEQTKARALAQAEEIAAKF